MAESKKYYWLKLKRDFFKRHDIRIIEEMPNGKDYILFYLKLLLESIDHEGSLRFSDTIPYNEQMLSVVTNTNIDIVRSAMKLFIELNMMSVFDDQTIYMNEVDKLIGCETEWAKKKRLYRETMDKERTLSSNCPTDVPSLSDKSKSIEKEKETEIEKEKEKKLKKKAYGKYSNVKLTDDEYNRLCNDYGQVQTEQAIDFLDAYIKEKGYKTKDHNLTLRRWVFKAVNENQPNAGDNKKPNRVAQTQNGTFDMLKDWSVSE